MVRVQDGVPVHDCPQCLIVPATGMVCARQPSPRQCQFMGQHGPALPSEQFGGGHLVMDFFWRRRGFRCVDASCAVQLALKAREDLI